MLLVDSKTHTYARTRDLNGAALHLQGAVNEITGLAANTDTAANMEAQRSLQIYNLESTDLKRLTAYLKP